VPAPGHPGRHPRITAYWPAPSKTPSASHAEIASDYGAPGLIVVRTDLKGNCLSAAATNASVGSEVIAHRAVRLADTSRQEGEPVAAALDH
jgi:hypothetical protein